MRKFSAISVLSVPFLLTGCATQQTYLGITASTQTWVNTFLVVSLVTLGLVFWGLVLLGRWLRVAWQAKK